MFVVKRGEYFRKYNIFEVDFDSGFVFPWDVSIKKECMTSHPSLFFKPQFLCKNHWKWDKMAPSIVRYAICDMIKGNESHVGNIQFWFFSINHLYIKNATFWSKPHLNRTSGCGDTNILWSLKTIKNIRMCHLFKPVTQNQYSRHPTHSPWPCHIYQHVIPINCYSEIPEKQRINVKLFKRRNYCSILPAIFYTKSYYMFTCCRRVRSFSSICRHEKKDLDYSPISEFLICHFVLHSNVNSIQNPSTVTNPKIEPCCILLPLTLTSRTTWQITNLQLSLLYTLV